MKENKDIPNIFKSHYVIFSKNINEHDIRYLYEYKDGYLVNIIDDNDKKEFKYNYYYMFSHKKTARTKILKVMNKIRTIEPGGRTYDFK